jgi:hypothetical protein
MKKETITIVNDLKRRASQRKPVCLLMSDKTPAKKTVTRVTDKSLGPARRVDPKENCAEELEMCKEDCRSLATEVKFRRAQVVTLEDQLREARVEIALLMADKATLIEELAHHRNRHGVI